MDFLIDCETETELHSIIQGLFEYLEKSNVTRLYDPNYFKRPTLESITYGKTNFMIFGELIDIEIMSRIRLVVPPYVSITFVTYL